MQQQSTLDEFVTRCVQHVIEVGLPMSSNIEKVYTPLARGIQNDGFRVMSSEFSACSTQSNRYAQLLSLKAWPAVKLWCEVFHTLAKEKRLTLIETWEQFQFYLQRQGIVGYQYWELPGIERTTDQVLQIRGMSLTEFISSGRFSRPLDLIVYVIQIVLFSVPFTSQFVKALHMEKVAEFYVKSRLFQGLFDQYLSKGSLSSAFVDADVQKQPGNLEYLTSATSVMELENMLHKTTVVGNDSVVLFAMLRSQVHKLFGKTSTHEYLHYLRVCEQEGINPVGFQLYQKIVHPILNNPTFEKFVDYSF